MPINIEIKARCEDQGVIRQVLQEKQADYKGIDHQVDTYFIVPNGRLKLRQGTIENNLAINLCDSIHCGLACQSLLQK